MKIGKVSDRKMSGSKYRWIDISYTMEPGMAIYSGNPGFDIKRISEITKGDNANVSQIVMGTHTGTHIDAPLHCIESGMGVADIPIEWLNGPATVIDATAHKFISVDFLSQYEINEGDRILFKTDNSSGKNVGRVLSEYCTLDYEAAEYLAKKKIRLVGIDYMSIERPRAQRRKGRSVHLSLLRNDIIILEEVLLHDVPAGECELHCLPLKLNVGDGCPVRAVIKREISDE